MKKPNRIWFEDDTAFIDVSTPKHPTAIATIDKADVELLDSVPGGRWFACSFDSQNIVYAVRTSHKVGERKLHFKLHRVVLGLTDPKVIVDHADRNGLNNTRQNLRLATRKQNACNSSISAVNKSGYRGVSLDPQSQRYVAQITHNYKSIFLGYWDDPVLAAAAYDGAARVLFGKFANRNFGGYNGV